MAIGSRLATAAFSLSLALAVGLASALAPRAAGSESDRAGAAFFEDEVRPVLVSRCYPCHSIGAESDGKGVRGGLRLDSAPGWRRGGESGPALVPFETESSRLVRAVRYESDDLRMPPRGKLPEKEIAALVEWVRRGAPDPRETEPAGEASSAKPRAIDAEASRSHFAFAPLRRVEPPVVGGPRGEKLGPVDRFIVRALEEKGLAPNPPAGARTLARRLSLDLTGLPPSPEAVEAFEREHAASPEAVARYADALLASPHFGERQARAWLDLARFGESHGFEHDYDRPNAWPYRDFVVRALNDDLPYDRFVSWQLAGDEIEPGNPLALAATGFLAAGVHSTQITKNQVEKERYDELDDMLRTTGTAMLGLTIGCARCHDHKYDPIPALDYYRMLSTFTTTVRADVGVDPDPESTRRAAAAWRAESERLLAERDAFDEAAFEKRFEAFLENPGAARAAAAPAWVVLDVVSATSHGGATLGPDRDGALAATGKGPDFDTYTLVAVTARAPITAIRIEALADPMNLVAGGPGRAGNGNFALSNVGVAAAPLDGSGPPVAIALKNAVATFEQKGLPAAAAVDADPVSAWAVDPRFGEDHAIVLETGRFEGFPGGTVLTVTLEFENNARHSIGRPRLAVSSASPPPAPLAPSVRQGDVEARAVLDAASGGLAAAARDALRRHYRGLDPEWRRVDGAVAAHAAREPKPALVPTLLATEGVGAVRLHTQGEDFLPETHFLVRGDPSQKREAVEPGFLGILSRAPEGENRWRLAPPPGATTSYRRRALAAWITDVDAGAGALLARVAVNRIWQGHFGRGLVATPSDFGLNGERPSHPDLLEWLAGELVANGWRRKPIHRLIVTSEAYRQSAEADPARIERDPDNALVSRFSRRRLEAEAIRDSMLAVAGTLDTRAGGPGTLDPRQRRRSLYFTVKRSRLVPMMTLFDAPDALQGLDRRPVTSVAPQALLFMNDPVVREIAAAFAGRIAASAPEGDPGDLVRAGFRFALARRPDAAEEAAARRFLAEQRASYGSRGAFDESLVDWALALFSLNEFVHVD